MGWSWIFSRSSTGELCLPVTSGPSLYSSQDMEVKRKALGIALEMVSSRNVEDVVLVLKKQLTSTMEQDYDKVSV
jgi:vesicle coat complex subunit